MIRVADYIMQRLAEFGVDDLFMLTGGGAMHLNDAAGRRLRCHYNHHEQASAIAAEGYARASGRPAIVIVTTGPGGLNTLTGVMGQWTDSVPVLYISGQVKFETTILSCPEVALRQLGDQEVNIVDVVRPLTKFAECVTDPTDIRRALEQAWHTATSGRPGPVWLDIPMNVQGAMIDQDSLTGYQTDLAPPFKEERIAAAVTEVVTRLMDAERPVVVAGHGIRISKCSELFFNVVEKLQIPILSSFNGFDLIPSDHPLFVGRIGTIGDRAGNFALQNADFILCLGTRNNIRQVSYGWQNYGRSAYKIVVDIDPAELDKPTLSADVKIEADVGLFLECLRTSTGADSNGLKREGWVEWCRERRYSLPVVQAQENYPAQPVHPYLFARILSEELSEDALVVTSNATANIAYFQGGLVKKGQRVIWNSGCASMGYDLPAAIGAAIATRKRVICLAGDGSLMMNLQELATIAYKRLPVVIFLFNNHGYVSIRQTQSNFFGAQYGCDTTTGVGFPDIRAVARAFGLDTIRIERNEEIRSSIRQLLAGDGPVLCELILDPDHTIEPKLSSVRLPDGRIISKPLEDMSPLLNREEFLQNMIVEPLSE